MGKLRSFVHLTFITIGIFGIVASVFVTPEFAKEFLYTDGRINLTYLEQLQNDRILAFLFGSLLISVGLLWQKYYQKILNFSAEHRIFVSVTHGRLVLFIGLGLHTFIYLLKTKYNTYFIDNKWYFAPLREDVMISMRYAYNLANGHGLVWNLGERVEGYTNFLWTVILALPHLFNVPTNISFLFPVICNILFFFISVFLVFKLLRHIVRSQVGAFLGTAVLCFFLPYSYWGSMGFETSILVLCNVIILYSIVKGVSSKDRNLPYFAASLALGIGWLVRDSYAIIVFTSIVPLFGLWLFKRHISLRQTATVAFVPLLLKLTHLAFRFWYYGSLLPNTYYLKATNWDKMDQLLQGWQYTLGFYKVLAPFLLLFAFTIVSYISSRSLRVKDEPAYMAVVGISLLSLLVQTFYVTWIGGDSFNSFRFYVILVPYLAILVGVMLDILGSVAKQQQALSVSLPVVILVIGIVLFFSVGEVNATALKDPPFIRVNTLAREHETLAQFMDLTHISQLDAITAPERNIRSALAIRTNANFDDVRSVAVYFAGTLPYLLGPEYHCTDLLGKMDPYIAQQEANVGSPPGHNKWDIEYSLEIRKPEIILSMFYVEDNKPLTQQFRKFREIDGFGGALYRSDSFMADYHLAYQVDRGFDLYARKEIMPIETNLDQLNQ